MRVGPRRRTPSIALTVMLNAFLYHSIYSQQPERNSGTPPAPISFDVVSIRPSQSSGPPIIQPTRNGLKATNVTVEDLVRSAFWTVAFQESRVRGLPEWAKLQKYDVTAKMATDDSGDLRAASDDAQELLRQQFLIDRFKLSYHFEAKEVSAFQLTVARGGPKLRVADPPADMATGILRAKPGSLVADGIRMDRLARYLMLIQDRPVIDKTGLTESYSFSLEWPVEDPTESSSAQEPESFGASSTLPVLLKEKLGLQLVGTHTPVKVLVIDHVERPSEN